MFLLNTTSISSTNSIPGSHNRTNPFFVADCVLHLTHCWQNFSAAETVNCRSQNSRPWTDSPILHWAMHADHWDLPHFEEGNKFCKEKSTKNFQLETSRHSSCSNQTKDFFDTVTTLNCLHIRDHSSIQVPRKYIPQDFMVVCRLPFGSYIPTSLLTWIELTSNSRGHSKHETYF